MVTFLVAVATHVTKEVQGRVHSGSQFGDTVVSGKMWCMDRRQVVMLHPQLGSRER